MTTQSHEYYNPVSDEEEILPAAGLNSRTPPLPSSTTHTHQHQPQTSNQQRRREDYDDDDDDDSNFNVGRQQHLPPPATTMYHVPKAPAATTSSTATSSYLPPPTVGSIVETNYIPYKYTVDEAKGVFRIFTRSTCGQLRKAFTMDVQSWSYLDIPTGHTNPARTVAILCEEMSTDRVSFDPSTGHFIVEPSEAVTQRVREAARKITRVPLTSFSVLSRFGHRFFDLLQENGRWVKKNSSSPSDPSSSSTVVPASAIPAGSTTRAAFQTVAWTVIDPGTISFIRSGVNCEENHPIINVWTIYSSFSGVQHSASAVASLVSNIPETLTSSHVVAAPSLDISVRVFTSQKEIISEFYNFLRNDVDIAVHYGETESPIATALRKHLLSDSSEGIAKITTGTLELFDLKDYVRNVYTDMSSHDFKTVITHINIYSSPEEKTTSATENSINHLTVAAATSLTGGASGDISSGGSDFFLPDLKTTIHSHENIAFFLEKIAAKTFLLSRLYTKLSKSIFDLAYLSGCNISTLTSRETTSRGVVAFIDPIAAWSQIVDTLPYDYMKSGIHSLTYVTPLSNILVDNMCKSDHLLTATIGKKLQSLKTYGWIVREVYSMRSLSPLPLPDIPSVFGIFRGMVYSTEEIKGYEFAREWSSIINVGLSSWIGISMIAGENDDADVNGGSPPPSITFGYFGIEDVCRHPFDAMRTAVEMFLSLSIYSNTPASAKTVAMTTVLTPENMTVRRKITAANLSTFSSLLPPSEVSQISEGNSETTLKLWYKSNDKFTTNPLLADRKVYVSMLETMLTQTFGFIGNGGNSGGGNSTPTTASSSLSTGGMMMHHQQHHHPQHQQRNQMMIQSSRTSSSHQNPLNPSSAVPITQDHQHGSSTLGNSRPQQKISSHDVSLSSQNKTTTTTSFSDQAFENVQTVKVQADRDRVFPGFQHQQYTRC